MRNLGPERTYGLTHRWCHSRWSGASASIDHVLTTLMLPWTVTRERGQMRDVILLDISPPGMDALEVPRDIGGIRGCSNIPVTALTATR